MRGLIVLALGLALPVLVGPPARATPPRRPTLLAPPHVIDGAGVVAAERWEVDCARVSTTSVCGATLTARLVGPARIDLTRSDDVWFGAILPEAPTARLDGVEVTLGAALAIAPGEHTLEFMAPLPVRFEARGEFLIFPADETRHLVLHDGLKDGSWSFHALASRAAARAPGYTLTVVVDADPRVVWAPSDARAWRAEGPHRYTFEATPEPAPPDAPDHAAHVEAFVNLRQDGELVHWGGPLLGLGLGWAGDASWFQARFEYEVAIADFILPGLSLDVSSHGAVLAPRIEVSTPQIALLPSLFAGAGLAIRLDPEPDPAARFLVGFHFGPIGGVISADLRPGDDGLTTELAALLRLSL
ncbi:MAG: hypothetical protein IT385_12045 [Deltaproteobacteria bacterium]|nr:hypothetical protein [Deltaproteobacteria bacterium]